MQPYAQYETYLSKIHNILQIFLCILNAVPRTSGAYGSLSVSKKLIRVLKTYHPRFQKGLAHVQRNLLSTMVSGIRDLPNYGKHDTV